MRKQHKNALVGGLIGIASSAQKARSISRFLKSCVFCAVSTNAGKTVSWLHRNALLHCLKRYKTYFRIIGSRRSYYCTYIPSVTARV
jgi:hypothetical protein